MWEIQHGESLGMVSMGELEDKELIKKSKLKYTDNEARGEKIERLFQILKNGRLLKMEEGNDI